MVPPGGQRPTIRLDRLISGKLATAALVLFTALAATARAQTDPGPVNMADRESARVWFNTWWPKTYGAPMGFTGNLSTGNAGDTSQAYKDQVLLRINILRRMTGAQPFVVNAEYSRKAQLAAMLMSVNGQVSHSPPNSWTFWSQDAFDGAGHSLLALGVTGPSAITQFLFDPGANNLAVGHRLDMLWPPLTTIGLGNVPSSGNYRDAAALWVSDSSYFSSNLRYSGLLSAWPTPGYTPHYLIPGRWSIQAVDSGLLSSTIAFNFAAVAVTKNGATQNVKTFTGSDGLTWTLDGTDEGDSAYISQTIYGEVFRANPTPQNDLLYHVKISNITERPYFSLYNGNGVVNGVYEYDVIGYNPSVAQVVPGRSAHLINISTRSFAGADSSTQIGGFIINGTSPRRVLIRAGGPYLSQYGIDNVLMDPVLSLYAGSTQIAVNDDWSSDAANVTAATTKAGAIAFATGSKDAAIVATLQPGVPYTAQITGKNGATGNALVEIFDIGDSSDSNLVNISTRSFVGTGASIQIGGFILHGSGPRKVLIRAGGPYLSQYNVGSVLADPVLKIFSGGIQIAENDDWSTNSADTLTATAKAGVVNFANGSKDAAIVLTLDPDVAYTAQVSGKNGGTGNALIEIFELKESGE